MFYQQNKVDPNNTLAVFEITLSNLRSDGEIDEKDFSSSWTFTEPKFAYIGKKPTPCCQELVGFDLGLYLLLITLPCTVWT